MDCWNLVKHLPKFHVEPRPVSERLLARINAMDFDSEPQSPSSDSSSSSINLPTTPASSLSSKNVNERPLGGKKSAKQGRANAFANADELETKKAKHEASQQMVQASMTKNTLLKQQNDLMLEQNEMTLILSLPVDNPLRVQYLELQAAKIMKRKLTEAAVEVAAEEAKVASQQAEAKAAQVKAAKDEQVDSDSDDHPLGNGM